MALLASFCSTSALPLKDVAALPALCIMTRASIIALLASFCRVWATLSTVPITLRASPSASVKPLAVLLASFSSSITSPETPSRDSSAVIVSMLLMVEARFFSMFLVSLEASKLLALPMALFSSLVTLEGSKLSSEVLAATFGKITS